MFPNLAETVILRDTWAVISRQVKAIGLEAWDKLFALNSDMSLYLPPGPDFDPAETRQISETVSKRTNLPFCVNP